MKSFKNAPSTALILILSIYSVHAQTLEWVKQFGGNNGASYGASVAVDAAGNVYTTGRFFGTIDFDPGPNTLDLTAGMFQEDDDIFVSKLDASGNLVWVKQMVGGGYDISKSIAVDEQGNVYTTGFFNGTVDFDPGAATYNLTTSEINALFISKLDALGNFVWAKHLGETGVNSGESITLDASGNIYVSGLFEQTASFVTESGTINLTSNGMTDGYISKLNSEGDFLWAKRIGGGGIDGCYSTAFDSDGNIFTTGNFTGIVDFNPDEAETYNLTSAGNWDAFILKLDASGNFVWAKNMGGSDYDIGTSIAIEANGDIYTTGTFRGTADFNPDGVATNSLTSAGIDDIFISKLDPLGNFIWAKRLGGTGSDRPYALKVDGLGEVYTTGLFTETADFNPDNEATYNLTSVALNDAFISKLDASGNFVWAHQIGGTNNQEGRSIALDAAGSIYTTGTFAGTTDFNPGSGVLELSATSSNAFVHKMSSTVGFNDIITNEDVIIFPNPAHSYLNIQSQTHLESVSIFNNLGSLVQTETKNYFSIEHLPAGIYLLYIKTDKRNRTIKFVKED